MPPGRPTNYDAKIARLVKELRKTLVAREAARIEASVSKHVDALVASMRGVDIGGAHPAHTIAETLIAAKDAAVATVKRVGRKGRSAASRALQAAKMKAYWAKRKAKEAMGGKAPKSATAKPKPKATRAPSAGRARQVAAMKAYWAKKKAAKA